MFRRLLYTSTQGERSAGDDTLRPEDRSGVVGQGTKVWTSVSRGRRRGKGCTCPRTLSTSGTVPDSESRRMHSDLRLGKRGYRSQKTP